MALFRTVSTTLTGKAMVAAATLTIVSGTAAGAAGLLAEDPPTALEEVTDTSEDGTETEGETTSPDPVEEEAPTEEETTEESLESEAPAEDETPEEAPAAEDEGEALTDGDTSDAEGRSANATRVLGELGDGCMPQDDDCHFGQEVSARAREKGPETSAGARGKKADRTAPEAPEDTADDEDDTIEPEPVTEDEPAAAEEVAAPDDGALTVANTESPSPRGKSKRR